ncbi:AraC family transcriptional regulator [Dinghuibacter silviterrae]|uniref:AraC-like protein n=1 Tax=Dinghuibacter silviterrae TaxID=1539049 RepID=A0A4R8DIR1_9BACT|nr:helix-turn-helix domain-containing protein [Dinghuibacter silviterrae]TDW97204.1 AraC-like protein [Dinghuibacter silviterrae]
MKRYLQYDRLKIDHFVTRRWKHPLHNHNHFELIFVHRGKGTHCLSGLHIPFEGPSLFLLSPHDVHRFVLEKETEFTFIKFSEQYLRPMTECRGSLLHNAPDTDKAERICRLILDAQQDEGGTVFFLIQALLSLAKRPSLAVAGKHADKVTGLLQYIHQHIYCPAYTQAEHLAAVFGFSAHYLGPFFRTHTGVTLREYVGRYKFQHIRNRLLHSSLSIKEISNELGFTDLSHFNKFFRARAGMTPTRFRAGGSER